MNIFHSLKKNHKSFNITEPDNEYKVKYLGNVLTAFMKGEGCVDKPVQILWDNFVKNEQTCLNMEMLVCASGLKVETKEQGLTEYRFHRIAFCTHLPSHPRVFVWVYRHEGKKLKVELRCHAVLLKSEEKAKEVHQQLQKKLNTALHEYTREMTRNQNSRLTLEKAKSVKLNNDSNNHLSLNNYNSLSRLNNTVNEKNGRTKSYTKGMDEQELVIPRSKPMRLMFLSQSDNYKPPSELSTKAPKLHSISEEIREEEEEEEEEEEDEEKISFVDEEKASIESQSICLNPYILPNLAPQKDFQDLGKDDSSNESGFMDENENEKI